MSEGKPAPAPPRFARRRPRGDEPEERDEEIHRGESRGEPLPEGLRRPPDKGGDESKERRVHARQEREDEDDREAREKPRPRVDGGEPPEAGRLHQASFFPASSRPRRRFEKMAATPKRPKIQPMPPTTSLTLIDGSSASASVRFIGLSWRWSALSTISSTSARVSAPAGAAAAAVWAAGAAEATAGAAGAFAASAAAEASAEISSGWTVHVFRWPSPALISTTRP